MMEYSWPGNIRQLKNAMVYAVYISKNGVINVNDLPEEIICNKTIEINSDSVSLKEAEKAAIIHAVYKNRNIGKAASELGLSRSTLYRRIKEYGIVI